MRIEDFKAGKRKVDPITVVLEAGHSFELDPEIIVRFGLRRGMDVDGALRARLESENEQLMARRRLVHYLSTRRKTTREAQLYLERAGFSPTAVEHAVGAARTLGLVAAIDLKPVDGKPGLRAYKAMENAFHDIGLLIRITADTIALSPPLMITRNQIEEIFMDKMPKVLASVASL